MTYCTDQSPLVSPLSSPSSAHATMNSSSSLAATVGGSDSTPLLSVTGRVQTSPFHSDASTECTPSAETFVHVASTSPAPLAASAGRVSGPSSAAIDTGALQTPASRVA